MSQLILTTVGGDPAEIVTLRENVDTTPGAGEVLVAVEAAPVNPADLMFQQGWFGVTPQVPQPLGAEGVGRVLAAGAAVDQSLVGRRVLILPTFVHGTWATRTVIPARTVVPVTEHADPRQLAMLPVNPATAYALLHDYVTVKPGDWVGVDLANSGVGQYVVQLARAAGIRTLAVVRREPAAQQVRALGADAVLLDGEGLGDRITETLGGARLRVFFEGTGGPEKLAAVVPAIEYGGAVVTFAAATGQSPVLPVGDFFFRRISLHSFYILAWLQETPRERLTEIYTHLAALVERGELHAAIEATYPLDRYREALAHAARPERTGKVLFTPSTADRPAA